MSLSIAAGLALLLAPGVTALGDEKPHGPNVEETWHEPEAPARGKPVQVYLALERPDAVTNVTLTYCRAEKYACAPSVAMEPNGPNGSYQGAIPWHAGFFKGVEHVGYNFTLKYANGTTTHSPRDYWPSRPASLPPEAGIYYFYKLPVEGFNASALGLAPMLAALVVAIGWMRV